MSDEQALLNAIRDNSEEDTPRLMYADWLDEHATNDTQRARAEFIRVSCEIARLNGEFQAPAYTEHWWHLTNRQHELYEQYNRDAFATLPEGMRPENYWCGFPVYLTLSGAECLTLPRPSWEQNPMLNVRLTGTTAEVCRVIESDWLAGIDSLHFPPDDDTDADKIVRTIARAPCAANLRWIYLINQSLTDAGMRALGKSTRFQRLKRFNIGGAFGIKGWAAALNGPLTERLTHLSFTYAPWDPELRPGPDAAASSAAAPQLRSLEEMTISRTRLGAEGIRSILTAPYLSNLRLLVLGQEDFDGPNAEALAVATLPKLEQLQISWSELPDAGLRALTKSGLLPQLTELYLAQNPISAEGIRALVEAGPLPRLKSLTLSETSLGDAGVIALARSPHLPGLMKLELAKCQIGPKGVRAMTEAPWGDRLVSLNLSDNPIRKLGVEALTSPGRLTRLLRLDLERSVRPKSLKDALAIRFGEGLNL
jgi:uncharacterized protein (TIGR02996 family)